MSEGYPAHLEYRSICGDLPALNHQTRVLISHVKLLKKKAKSYKSVPRTLLDELVRLEGMANDLHRKYLNFENRVSNLAGRTRRRRSMGCGSFDLGSLRAVLYGTNLALQELQGALKEYAEEVNVWMKRPGIYSDPLAHKVAGAVTTIARVIDLIVRVVKKQINGYY